MTYNQIIHDKKDYLSKMTISDKIKTIHHKIEQHKAQYNLDRLRFLLSHQKMLANMHF